MPLFDAISSLFSHKAVSAVTNPSVSSTGFGSSAITVNSKGFRIAGGCDSCNVTNIEVDEPCNKPKKPSCQRKEKDDSWRVELLEELRRLEEHSNLSEAENKQTRDFLLQQLAYYEQQLLKVQESETIVKERQVPIPVRVPVPIAVRVPVIQRETRVISQSPCRNASLCPWRGRSCSAGIRAPSPCQRARCQSNNGGSIARLVAAASRSPCAARRSPCGAKRCSAGIDVGRYQSRLSQLTKSEKALAERISARRSVARKVNRTLSKLTRAQQEEQRSLSKIAADKRKTVQSAFKELQEKKEEEYRAHAERINDQLRAEQERLADHLHKLQDWRTEKMTEMKRLEQSAAVAMKSYDMQLRRNLAGF